MSAIALEKLKQERWMGSTGPKKERLQLKHGGQGRPHWEVTSAQRPKGWEEAGSEDIREETAPSKGNHSAKALRQEHVCAIWGQWREDDD